MNLKNNSLRNLNFSLAIFLLAGIITNFIGATIVLLSKLLFYNKKQNIVFLFICFLLTFILANNSYGVFAYFGNFRFIILGITILFLYPYKSIKKNLSLLTLPFSLYALLVTVGFSNLGIFAILRCLSYFLMAYTVNKLTAILYANYSDISKLIFYFFFCFVAVNALLVIFPEFYLMGRFKGLTGNPNGLGMLLVFFTLIVSLLFLREQWIGNKMRRLLQVYSVLTFLLIVLSGSRTAFVVYLFLNAFNLYKKNINYRVPLIILILFLSVFFISTDIINSIQSVGLSEIIRIDTLYSASGRIEVWQVVWDKILEQPWFGNGFMYDDFYLAEYVNQFIGEYRGRHWGGVWSSYLSLLINVGIIGLVLYIVMIYGFHKRAHYKKHSINFIISVALIGVTESWMASSMNPFTPLLFLYFAIQSQPFPKSKNLTL